MEVHDSADIVVALLVLAHDLLVVSLTQEGQSHTVAAQRRLDHIGNVVLVLLLIEVVEALAGGLLVAAQVVVGTVSNAPQLAPAVAEGELELDVGGSTGVESQLCVCVTTSPQSWPSSPAPPPISSTSSRSAPAGASCGALPTVPTTTWAAIWRPPARVSTTSIRKRTSTTSPTS